MKMKMEPKGNSAFRFENKYSPDQYSIMSAPLPYSRSCCLSVVTCAMVSCGTVLIVEGINARRLAEGLEPSCVVGHEYRITNEEETVFFPSYLVSRDDAGILYAKWILGNASGATGQSAAELIRSQTITLGNWTARVTQNKLQVDPRIAGFPLWEYPVDVPDDQSGGHSSIAIAGQLPDGVDGRGPFAIDTKYSYTGIGYCDSGSAEGNVWFEFRDWLPDAAYSVGLASVILALIAACFCAWACCDESMDMLHITRLVPYLLHPVGYGAVVVLVLASAIGLAVAAIAAISFLWRGPAYGTPQWDVDLLYGSPQTKRVYRLAAASIYFVCFLGAIYLYIAMCLFPCWWNKTLRSISTVDYEPDDLTDPHGAANMNAHAPHAPLEQDQGHAHAGVQVHPLAVYPGQGDLDNGPLDIPGSDNEEAETRSHSSQEISGDGTPLAP